MNGIPTQALHRFLRTSRPLLLLYGVLLHALGAAIARYLGITVRPLPYLASQAIVLALQLGSHYAAAYFDPRSRTLRGPQPDQESDSDGTQSATRSIPRSWQLYVAAAAFGLAVVLLAAMLASATAPALSVILLLLGTVAGVLYAVPPVRLAESGYGELLAAVCTALLIPAISFSFHAGELHRLLLPTTAPLACFTFAALLISQLRSYASDVKSRHGGLMLHLGWERALRVHDGAIGLGVILQLSLLFLGYPQRVALGGLLGTPLAVGLIWYLGRIRAGAPPRWNLLHWSSRGLVGLMAYLALAGFLLS